MVRIMAAHEIIEHVCGVLDVFRQIGYLPRHSRNSLIIMHTVVGYTFSKDTCRHRRQHRASLTQQASGLQPFPSHTPQISHLCQVLGRCWRQYWHKYLFLERRNHPVKEVRFARMQKSINGVGVVKCVRGVDFSLGQRYQTLSPPHFIL